MLPSSHSVLIPDAPEVLDFQGAAGKSHNDPAKLVAAVPGSDAGIQTILASAFSDFMSASMRLEQSYRALQEEVSILRQELTTRNAALEQSRIQNRRMQLDLERIVESMPCGVIVARKDGKIALINREGLRLLNVEQFDMPQSIHALGALLGVEAERLTQTTGSADAMAEVRSMRGKQERWIEIRNHHHVESDQTQRQILILRDVTARKLAEGKREEGRRAMALAEVAADIAHEIRNPLASLELFAGLIEADDLQRDQWISHLRAGIRSLSTTVNNVLLMQSGHLSLTSLNLPDTLESALNFARPVAEQAEVQLRWHRTLDTFLIQGNACALQQVVLNLVVNAIRHTSSNGCLAISVHRNHQGCEVEFQDSGEGFPEEALGQLMEAGFSGRGDTSGRGLAVCKQIMHEHGGHIHLDNGPNGGARIRLTFPAAQEGMQ